VSLSYDEGDWPSASGQRLFYRFWQPPEAQALVVIIHGFGEHGGRYAPVAEALAEHGIAVAAPDLCGHGRSSGARGDVADVSRCADDVALMSAQVFRPRAGQDRYVVFGHSFGGLVAILLALEHPDGPRRLMIQSPFFEAGFPIPGWKVAAAKLLAAIWPTASLSTDLPVEALSHDPAVLQAYRSDPLVHQVMSARAYRAVRHASGDVMARAAELSIPTLLLCGTGDRIVSVEAARCWFERLRCDKRRVEFPGAYHELHHEPVRADVLRLIQEWTLAHA